MKSGTAKCELWSLLLIQVWIVCVDVYILFTSHVNSWGFFLLWNWKWLWYLMDMKGPFFSPQFIVKLFLSRPHSWSSTGHIYAINHHGFQDFDIDSTSTLYLRIEVCLWKVPVDIHERTVHRIMLVEITKFTFCPLSHMQSCPGYLEFWMYQLSFCTHNICDSLLSIWNPWCCEQLI